MTMLSKYFACPIAATKSNADSILYFSIIAFMFSKCKDKYFIANLWFGVRITSSPYGYGFENIRVIVCIFKLSLSKLLTYPFPIDLFILLL